MANVTFCPQDVQYSPFVENTRRNATLRNVSQSIFYGNRSHFYGTWSANPLVTLVFMYLRQKDVLPDSK